MKLQKETAPHGKWYDDACGAAFALELIGERWSLLIMRELMFGSRRFTDLRAGLPAISAKVLTERLEGLERARVIQRRQLPPPAATQVYELTDWGYQLDETVLSLCRWALASPGHDHSLPLSGAALMMSLRALFDSSRARNWAVTGAIEIGGETYLAVVAAGLLTVTRGESAGAEFVIAVPDAGTMKRLVYGKASPDSLAGAGLVLTGDDETALRFIDLFHLPAKIG
jgi:DNA-binding HxlR family transcriptional regulator